MMRRMNDEHAKGGEQVNDEKWREHLKQLRDHPDFAIDPYGCMVDMIRIAVKTAIKHEGAVGAGAEWEIVQKFNELLERA